MHCLPVQWKVSRALPGLHLVPSFKHLALHPLEGPKGQGVSLLRLPQLPCQRKMARFDSAAAIRVALNSLSPQDAWGDRASVSKMFDDGFRSLSHIANASPQLLTGYGVPLGQIGHLQHEAREALPRGAGLEAVQASPRSC